MIKVDQSCAGNTDKCVTGAACDTTSGNNCKCGDGYQEVAVSKTCGKRESSYLERLSKIPLCVINILKLCMVSREHVTIESPP